MKVFIKTGLKSGLAQFSQDRFFGEKVDPNSRPLVVKTGFKSGRTTYGANWTKAT